MFLPPVGSGPVWTPAYPPPASALGARSLLLGAQLQGFVTAGVSTALGLDSFTAWTGANPSGLCCVFVSGVLAKLGVPVSPYQYGNVPGLEAALGLLGFRVTPVNQAPPGSVVFFQRPQDPGPWHT